MRPDASSFSFNELLQGSILWSRLQRERRKKFQVLRRCVGRKNWEARRQQLVDQHEKGQTGETKSNRK